MNPQKDFSPWAFLLFFTLLTLGCSKGDKGTETKKPYANCNGALASMFLNDSQSPRLSAACAEDIFNEVNKSLGESSNIGVFPDGSRAAPMTAAQEAAFFKFYKKANVYLYISESLGRSGGDWINALTGVVQGDEAVSSAMSPGEPDIISALIGQINNNCFQLSEGYQLPDVSSVSDGLINFTGAVRVENPDSPACPVKLSIGDSYSLRFIKVEGGASFEGSHAQSVSILPLPGELTDALTQERVKLARANKFSYVGRGRSSRWVWKRELSGDFTDREIGSVRFSFAKASSDDHDEVGLMQKKLKSAAVYDFGAFRALVQIFGVEGRDGRGNYRLFLNGEELKPAGNNYQRIMTP